MTNICQQIDLNHNEIFTCYCYVLRVYHLYVWYGSHVSDYVCVWFAWLIW